MPLLVGSVIRRHLRSTSGFQVAEPGALPPHGFCAPEGEEVIGWYINEPCGPSVIFTNASGIRSKAAKRDHVKTGQRGGEQDEFLVL